MTWPVTLHDYAIVADVRLRPTAPVLRVRFAVLAVTLAQARRVALRAIEQHGHEALTLHVDQQKVGTA